VPLWCNWFGPLFSTRLKRRHPGFGDTSFIDQDAELVDYLDYH
jgi:hypothetical protein